MVAQDSWKCRFCGRRSERVSLGMSCFHCGHTQEPFQWFDGVKFLAVLLVTGAFVRLVLY